MRLTWRKRLSRGQIGRIMPVFDDAIEAARQLGELAPDNGAKTAAQRAHHRLSDIRVTAAAGMLPAPRTDRGLGLDGHVSMLHWAPYPQLRPQVERILAVEQRWRRDLANPLLRTVATVFRKL
jgi:hypothetical protein